MASDAIGCPHRIMDKRGTKRKLERTTQQEAEQPRGPNRRLNAAQEDGLSFLIAPRFGAFLPPAEPATHQDNINAGSVGAKLQNGPSVLSRANRRLAALIRRHGPVAEAESWDAPEFNDAEGEYPSSQDGAQPQLAIAGRPTDDKAGSTGMAGKAAVASASILKIDAQTASRDTQQPAGDELGAGHACAAWPSDSMSTASTEPTKEAAQSGVPASPAFAFPSDANIPAAAAPTASRGSLPAHASSPAQDTGASGMFNTSKLDSLALPTTALPAFGQPHPPVEAGAGLFSFGNSAVQALAPASQEGTIQQPALPFALGPPAAEAPQQPGLVFGQSPAVQVPSRSMHLQGQMHRPMWPGGHEAL